MTATPGSPAAPERLAPTAPPGLDAATAARLAELVLAALHRPYPTKIAHVLHDDADALPPRRLTPMFYGSFDWHSAVHGHWSVARLLRMLPAAPWAEAAERALARSFTAEQAAGELAYLERHPGFEMPYGVAWLLLLSAELEPFPRWREALAPLVRLARDRFAAWIVRLPLPIRSGEHTQSAFAMGLALDYARAAGDEELAAAVAQRARDFYAGDRDAPVTYEPSAYDFLSPSLAEADLMRRVMPAAEHASWLAAFLPAFAFTPVHCVDRADGKLSHFDGLNLSRAWMLRKLGQRELAELHAAAGLAGITGEHYAGAHWLGTYALYWLTDRS
jgi:hypothetical protein